MREKNVGHGVYACTWTLQQPVEYFFHHHWVELDELGKGINHLFLRQSSQHRDEEAHIWHTLSVQVSHTLY